MLGKLQFGVYELDRDTMELCKRGAPVRLQEQPLRVLASLVERPGEIVTREELRERIWGKDTFVDFEQSLNKAVNRLREALNDEAGQPRYVETVPRRGYRFIAPVTELNSTEQPRPLVLPDSVSDAPGSSRPRRARIGTIALLATAAFLLAVGITVLLLGRRPEKFSSAEIKHMTSAFCCPRLSRDGKLLAYASNAGSGIHIWVQQTAGGEPIQVTRGSAGEICPDFSPDGTHIAFVSGRANIYIAPTLSGEPKLIAKTEGGPPLFSPSGQKILYWEGTNAMIVSVDSGERISLSLNRDFLLHEPPLWSPGEDKILFYGVRRRDSDKPDGWWIAPLTAGEPRLVRLPDMEQNDSEFLFLRAWVRSQDGAEWFIYSASRGQVWKLYRVRVTTQGQIEGKPEQLASGTGVISYMVSVSQDGKLVYQTGGVTESILEIPTDSRGQKLGPSFQLPLPEDGNYRSPSVSRDGRWMAYDASIRGKSNIIRLRDLRSGVDQFVDDTGRSPGAGGETSISPDGSKIIFDRNCKSGKWESGQALPCGFMVSAAGEEPEQLCEFCTARGFSSNGSVVLIQKYNKDGGFKPPHRIAAVDLTSRTEKKFLNSSENSVYHAFFSWDDRWVVFKKQLEPQKLQISQSLKAQIMIAPMRNGAPSKEAEWIAVTDGQYNDDKPQFSPDGNTVYFISTRDGYFCIWAQRLDPATKRPVGAPLAYEHFHNSVLRYQPFIDIIDSDLSVASDKILINLPQWSADVWMTQIE